MKKTILAATLMSAATAGVMAQHRLLEENGFDVRKQEVAPPPPLPEVAPGQTWRHLKRGTTYRVVHLDRFVPKDRKPVEEGVMLATPDRGVRAILQCSKPLEYGTEIVVYVSTKQLTGKQWVRPLSEFTDGRFVRAD